MADRWPDRLAVAQRLVDLGCDDETVLTDLLAAKPDLTLEQIEAQWQIAQQREQNSYTDNARALLFGTLRKPGGWLYGRATSGQPDWAAYTREQAAAAAAPAPAAQIAAAEAAAAQARQIAADGTPDELAIIAADLLAGRTPAAAREWLAAERARRAYLDQRTRGRLYDA